MDENYIFYQGWNKKSIGMEKFMKEHKIPYIIKHQEIGEQAVIFAPGFEDFYNEDHFDELRLRILEEII